jgi:hypothetical protein
MRVRLTVRYRTLARAAGQVVFVVQSHVAISEYRVLENPPLASLYLDLAPRNGKRGVLKPKKEPAGQDKPADSL